MGKRAHGEGSIWQEGAYWVGALMVDGVRRKVKAKSRQQVLVRLGDLRRAAEQGTHRTVDSRRMTVTRWMTEWLGGLSVDERTRQGYAQHVRDHIVPALGRRPLRSLSRADVRGFCARLMLPTEEGGKGLHQTTAHNVGRTLHIALAVAVDDGVLVRNPASGRGVIPPARSRRMSWWSDAEVTAFLEAVEDDPMADFFHLALDTGDREGELLALRWRDLDLDRSQLVIGASISQVGRRRKEPKSRRGVRPIDLSASVVDRLRARRSVRRVVGLGGEELVFPGEGGGPLHPSKVTRHLNWTVDRAGVKRIRFHDLRHTHATLALQRGEPVPDVAARLGHDPATLLRVYAHAVPPASRGDRLGFLDRVAAAIAPKIAPKAASGEGKVWRAQEDLNPRARIRSPLLYPG